MPWIGRGSSARPLLRPSGLTLVRPFSPRLSEMAPTNPSEAPAKASEPQPNECENLRMQIVIRRDLKSDLGWPEGPIIAQGSHAATAVLHKFKEDAQVVEYLDRLESMHKVIWSTKDEKTLLALSDKLSAQDPPIKHYVWVEQPENIPTALAVVPNRLEQGVLALIKKSKCSSWK